MARKGLGRGLEAILGDAEDSPSFDTARPPKDGIQMISLGDIRPDPEQPRKRFVDEELDELAASIKTQGLLQPILVRPDDSDERCFIIIAGERRWRACAKAGRHDIPALVRQANLLAVTEMALIENLQRTDLNPMEEADAYAIMRDKQKRKPADIAEAVGKSRSHVANMLRLVTLPKMLREYVVRGALSMGHARALLGAKNAEKLANTVVAKRLSVRETEKLVAGTANTANKKTTNFEDPKAASSGRTKDADTKSLERDLEAVLGLSVAIEHGKKGGNVTLTYDTLEQLDDICRRLMGTAV